MVEDRVSPLPAENYVLMLKTRDPDELRLLQDSIRVTEQLRLHSIAFPAISTGIERYPVHQAAAVAVPTLLQELRNARHIVMISLVLYDRATLDAFSQAALAYCDNNSGKALPYSIAILD